jgi:hypothetical protein
MNVQPEDKRESAEKRVVEHESGYYLVGIKSGDLVSVFNYSKVTKLMVRTNTSTVVLFNILILFTSHAQAGMNVGFS